MPLSETAPAPSTGKWLSVIGIGEDGVAGLGERAKRLIAEAGTVFGGERHLELAHTLTKGEVVSWPKPFDAGMALVRERRGRKTCVLASGDPFCHGVGVTLARHVPIEEMDVIPAPSAFSLAASRLGWALHDTETISVHGKPVSLLRPHLHPNARLLVLTSDENGPAQVARLLGQTGFAQSRVTVLEALGGEREKITHHIAESLAGSFDALNLLAIEVLGKGSPLPFAPGLPDDAFAHDHQITKRSIRALTLSALAPRRGELLWDVGAGSGSIGIEWMLCHPSLNTIAIEPRADRAANIRLNADTLGAPGLKLVEGRAPDALAGLPTPDAIFIGGGGSESGVMEAAIVALRSGGRLVANAVTLEMEAVLLREHATRGGELQRIQLARAEGVGTMTGWRPAMPVTQWSWVKP
ncbi:precorrin-6y C5,15-methyltransferase (decarboxylating) subunit CbiE [Mesorhizobium sp. RP14(2022)]|uniref:Precorrin-6y C5,15-methyltransferase (Decarboxylating) subunit CbiE n=1 Tax=Mesorhizobium liriopis TaxID=2953882 RepID=A0ABT1C4M9_9HYPH|nr:precorrin-6y C5,15-methyltransferase (decarboxylating) subunit CbiE [Mesorhizobium liriopis]MCO6049794.1 precorrin-6y C5,15-methyltransferase (decarboxylating) subunit CbiE [Mesorhizobium liriopis]